MDAPPFAEPTNINFNKCAYVVINLLPLRFINFWPQLYVNTCECIFKIHVLFLPVQLNYIIKTNNAGNTRLVRLHLWEEGHCSEGGSSTRNINSALFPQVWPDLFPAFSFLISDIQHLQFFAFPHCTSLWLFIANTNKLGTNNCIQIIGPWLVFLYKALSISGASLSHAGQLQH